MNALSFQMRRSSSAGFAMPVPLPPSLSSSPSHPNLSYNSQRRPSQLYPTQPIPKRTVELRKSHGMGHRRNHSAGAAAVVFSLVAFCGSVAEAAPIPDASGIQFRAVDYGSAKEKLGEVNGKVGAAASELGKRRVDGTAKPNELACLDSSADEKVINSLLFHGGEGSVVQLCAGAQITINNPIQFSHPGQEISTIGYPTDRTRATITITGKEQSTAIFSKQTGSQLKNIQIDGNADRLGKIAHGASLVQLAKGGDIQDSHLSEPRAGLTYSMV